MKVKSIGELEGQTFCQDSHCWDLLVFPALLKAQLYSTRLLSDYKLIIQVQVPEKKQIFEKSNLLSVDFNITVKILSAPSILSDMYDFTLIMDLLKLIVRLRSIMLSKISYNISHHVSFSHLNELFVLP